MTVIGNRQVEFHVSCGLATSTLHKPVCHPQAPELFEVPLVTSHQNKIVLLGDGCHLSVHEGGCLASCSKPCAFAEELGFVVASSIQSLPTCGGGLGRGG